MGTAVTIDHLIQVSSLAWTLYKSCKDSSDEFKRISHEVASLHVVLKETEDYIVESKGLSSPTRDDRLGTLIDGCKNVLAELKRLLDGYDSLGTQAQRTWDRMRWGLEDLAEVRSRIISNTTLLTAFNTQLASSSTARIERRLTKFIAEIRAGLREGSVVSTSTVAQTIESEDVWDELKRELEDVGISGSAVSDNQPYIKNWLQTAITNGMLQEEVPSKRVHLGSVDSGYDGSSVGPSYPTTTARMSVTTANHEFEKDLKKHPTRANLASATAQPDQTPVQVRKASTVSSVLFKLLKNDTDIVQAASDNNLKKVVKLLSMGANVNARDRWGWSALSMAAYGGHVDIARLLLEHGGDLNNVDVDGDTPELLAANRGHAAVVFLFEEERQRRDLKVREADNEVPRAVNS